MSLTAKLSPKRQRFVDEYKLDTNGAQAAIRAGYSPRSAKVTASRLLTDANVQAAIAAGAAALAEAVEIGKEWVIAGFRSIADDPDARDADRIAATREIGKLLGFYVDRSVNVSTFVRPELARIPADKLAIMQEIAYPGSTGEPAIEAAVSRLLPAIDGEARVLEEGAA